MGWCSVEAGTLTLEQAVATGLERNQTVTDSLLAARQAAVEWVRVQGVYDTELRVNAYYSDSELSPATSPIDSAAEVLHGDIGMSRRFSTGTELDAALNTDHVRFPESDFASENNQTAITLSLRQPLIRNAGGAETEAAIDAAEARYRAAWQRYLDARNEVAYRIHAAFWRAYGDFAGWEVRQSALERAEELLSINRARERDGILDETDVLDAEASLAGQTVQVLVQQDRFITSREELLALLQIPLANWSQTFFAYDESLDGMEIEIEEDPWALYRTARANRQDFQALARELEAARFQRIQAEEELKPELNLFGEFQAGNNDESWDQSVALDRTSWTVGIEFRRGWNRTAEKSALRNAELQEARIRGDIQQAEQNLMLSVRRSIRDLLTLNARVEAASITRRLNARKLRLEEEKYRQGQSDSRRMIDFQNDLEAAEEQEILAVSERLIRSAEQLRLAGSLVDRLDSDPEETHQGAP